MLSPQVHYGMHGWIFFMQVFYQISPTGQQYIELHLLQRVPEISVDCTGCSIATKYDRIEVPQQQLF